jgi:hypothetical protein
MSQVTCVTTLVPVELIWDAIPNIMTCLLKFFCQALQVLKTLTNFNQIVI